MLILVVIFFPADAFSSSNNSNESINIHQDSSAKEAVPGLRLNKCFRSTHSRRQADAMIQSGRVHVNGVLVTEAGTRVQPNDIVQLDGMEVDWQQLNQHDASFQKPTVSADTTTSSTETFEYIKYWKPRGVISTTDTRIRDNILDALRQESDYRPSHRCFPVGRLDKDTTGLILLTSDGRVPNAIGRAVQQKQKTYHVMTNRPVSDQDIQDLRDGVVITTVAQRDNKAKPLTAKTLPCQCRRLKTPFYESANSYVSRSQQLCQLEMTIVEGRNRQIRKMLQALGYHVVDLHRVNVHGITLDGLDGPGSWAHLSPSEMKVITTALSEYMTNERTK